MIDVITDSEVGCHGDYMAGSKGFPVTSCVLCVSHARTESVAMRRVASSSLPRMHICTYIYRLTNTRAHVCAYASVQQRLRRDVYRSVQEAGRASSHRLLLIAYIYTQVL